VVVYRGVSSPQWQEKAGPFASGEAAIAWCEARGLEMAPSDDEWGVVFPDPAPGGEDD